MQQINEEVSRCLRIPIQDSTSLIVELPAAAARASNFMAFDADDNPIMAAGTIGTPAVPVSAYMETLLCTLTLFPMVTPLATLTF